MSWRGCRRRRSPTRIAASFVRGDKSVAYGRMIEVMVTIRQGGFSKVSLLVEQTDGGPGSTAPSMTAPTVSRRRRSPRRPRRYPPRPCRRADAEHDGPAGMKNNRLGRGAAALVRDPPRAGIGAAVRRAQAAAGKAAGAGQLRRGRGGTEAGGAQVDRVRACARLNRRRPWPRPSRRRRSRRSPPRRSHRRHLLRPRRRRHLHRRPTPPPPTPPPPTPAPTPAACAGAIAHRGAAAPALRRRRHRRRPRRRPCPRRPVPVPPTPPPPPPTADAAEPEQPAEPGADPGGGQSQPAQHAGETALAPAADGGTDRPLQPAALTGAPQRGRQRTRARTTPRSRPWSVALSAKRCAIAGRVMPARCMPTPSPCI